MNFEERFAQTKAKMEEMKARISDSIESAKKADQLKKDEILVKLAKMDAAIEDFNRDVQAQVYCDVTSMKEEAKADMDAIGKAIDDLDAKIEDKANKNAEKLDEALDRFDAKIDDNIATVEGAVNAAEENRRIARERYEGKLNAARLKAQMNVEASKARVEARKEAVDKAAQEQLIIDLLDYADGCQQMALAFAMEAELAILEACEEIEDYEAKYGKKDE